MKLSFVPLDISRNRDIIIRFRADSFVVSFGSADALFGEDGRGAERYLEILKVRSANLGSCVHVIHEREIVGQIELRPMREETDAGYVNLFYLIPELRGKGVGMQLEAYATQYFLRQGFKRAYLNVSPTNQPALRFYEKHGWMIIDRIHKSGSEVFVMKKDLSLTPGTGGGGGGSGY